MSDRSSLYADAIEEIFAPGGINDRSNGRHYRESQHEGVKWLHKALTHDVSALRRENPRIGTFDTPDTRPLVTAGQFEMGCGKTDMIIAAAGLKSIIYNERSLILTPTTALRAAMLRAVTPINNMLAQLTCMTCRPITYTERRSYSSIISLVKARALLSDSERLIIPPDERKKIEDFIREVERSYMDGKTPTIDKFFSYIPTIDGSIPDLRLTKGESEGKAGLSPYTVDGRQVDFSAIVKEVLEGDAAEKKSDRDGSHGTDLIFATQTMGATSFRAYGFIFGTYTEEQARRRNMPENPNRRLIKQVLIDEADVYRDAARAIYETRAQYDDLLDLCLYLQKNYSGPNLSEALAAIKAFMDDYTVEGPIETPAKRSTFANLVGALHTALVPYIVVMEQSLDELSRQDMLRYQALDDTISVLYQIQEAILFSDTTESKGDIPALRRVHIRFTDGEPSGFGVFANRARNTANRVWRTSGTIEYVALMSGTLSGFREPLTNKGGVPKFDIFCKTHGLREGSDLPFNFVNFEATDHGKIGRLSFRKTNTSVPFISHDKDDGTRKADTFEINPRFIKDTADIIAEAVMLPHLRPESRAKQTAVFFASDESLSLTLEQLRTTHPSLASKVLAQRRGMNADSVLKRFLDDDEAIWFGLIWTGLNFVDDRGKTVLGRIIVPRFRVAPPDHTQVDEDSYFSMRAGIDYGARYVLQAIGRGIRNAEDLVDVHLLDPRNTPYDLRDSQGRLDSVDGQLVARLRKAMKGRLKPHHQSAAMTRFYADAARGIRQRWIAHDGQLDAQIGIWDDTTLLTC